jgi:hypothetical protein
LIKVIQKLFFYLSEKFMKNFLVIIFFVMASAQAQKQDSTNLESSQSSKGSSEQQASLLRGSGTPAGGDDSFVLGGNPALETGRISPMAAPANPAFGQSMGKDSNMSMLTKDYVDAEKKILRVLSQRYELKEELGKGAHGRIYSGRDKITKMPIAIKVVSIIDSHRIYRKNFINRWRKSRKTKASLYEKFH